MKHAQQVSLIEKGLIVILLACAGLFIYAVWPS